MDSKFLHIYAQSYWHSPAYIVGTKQSIANLIKAAEAAIQDGKSDDSTFFASDGEGYHLNIACVDDITQHLLRMPYTDTEITDGSGLNHDEIEPEQALIDPVPRTTCLGPFADKVVNIYKNSTNSYHNLNHIKYCFKVFDRLYWNNCESKIAIELAIWFHDIVYDPKSKINEEDSVNFFINTMSGYLNDDLIENVSKLILATRHNIKPESVDEQVMCDIDLAIFWEGDFNEYESNIRKEYDFVDDDTYKAGRCNLLQYFLDRESIYYTKMGQAWMEPNARYNLEKKIKELSNGGISEQ